MDFESWTFHVKQNHSLASENSDVDLKGEWRGMVPAPPSIPVAPLLKRQVMEL